MSWEKFQVLDFESLADYQSSQQESYSNTLLEWIVDNSFFKTEIFEDKLDISGQVFYRFYIQGTTKDNLILSGLGRSRNRLTAASIAAGELIERYVAKEVFKNDGIQAKHLVLAEEGSISLQKNESAQKLPSKGFHSSNGWAVHFDIRKSIEKSFVEAIERHTLLYSFLKNGWNGFIKDQSVPFNEVSLTPYISKNTFGGFAAGIVSSQNSHFLGHTFGYICDATENIESSSKWLSAFFESHDQLEILSQEKEPKTNTNIIYDYQKYFLQNSTINETANGDNTESVAIEGISANLIAFDVQKALNLPCPLYAAFSFGQDLIPLFFKQKLSESESQELGNRLKYWSLSEQLPEYHPIL